MNKPAKAKGPLSGVRVVDLTAMVMGPYATQIMADNGADVIKVEPPQGDDTRYISAGPERGLCGVFVNVNRGKRGIMLDLTTKDGKAALRKLVATGDVFIHSMNGQNVLLAGTSVNGGAPHATSAALGPNFVRNKKAAIAWRVTEAVGLNEPSA